MEYNIVKNSKFWWGILVSLLCLAVVLWLVDLEQVALTLRENDWRLAILGFATCQIVFGLLRAWRWRLMLTLRVGYWNLFHAQNVGYLVNNVLPLRLGDLARAYLVGLEPGMSGVQALSTVALERILDALIVGLIFGVAVATAPALPAALDTAGLVFSLVAVCVFGVMLLSAAHQPKATRIARWFLGKVRWLDQETWLRRVESFLGGLSTLTKWRLLLAVSVLSALVWLAVVAGYFGGLVSFWSDASLTAALLAVSAAALGISAPSSPGSVGVYHGSVMLGLSVFPVTPEQALSYAIVIHFTMVVVNMVMGAIGLWYSGRSLGTIVSAIRAPGKP